MVALGKTLFSTGNRLRIVLFSLCLLLAACDSAEERAEAHFQAGMAHLEEGDVERALIEFKNVFKLNGKHKEARLTFARLERERGNISTAYSQYLLLIEQYPDNLEGHRALAEMALQLNNMDDVRRFVTVASSLAPEDVEVWAINNTLAYSDALEADSPQVAEKAVATARDILNGRPELLTARRIIIDNQLRNQNWDALLDEVDTALTFAPEQSSLYAIRLQALAELDRVADIEAQLRNMREVFPEDSGVVQMLFEHYVTQQNLDAAEQILREETDLSVEDSATLERLVAFLNAYRGREVAISELDSIIASDGPNAPRAKAMRASMKFLTGDTQGALSEMQALLENAPRTTQTRENEVEYARMLFATEQPDEARSLIETVLAEDPTQTDAVKLTAAWQIEEDRIGDAILLLREALSAAPRDSGLMLLMAQAHERNGDRQLAGEMLALAVEVSQSAPGEVLRYVSFLAQTDDLEIAESILVEAVRQNPGNPVLLLQLGQIYLNMQNWVRLETVLTAVQDIGDDSAALQANELRAQMLATQKRTQDLSDFLNELASDPEFGLPADIALIRLMLTQGDIAGANAHLEQLLSEDPDSLILRFVKARALTSEGQLDEAERVYRDILRSHPDSARGWLALYLLLMQHDQPDEARVVLKDALIEHPDNPDFLMLEAGEYERAGDLDQAIAAYEKLYPLSNRSEIVANNLASLLTTHRNDDESLQTAQRLVRRLRGTRVPAFQDTYGWVAFRLGNIEEAISYLEPAAQALPDHPQVLFHLGKAYAAAGRAEEALLTFRAAQATGAGSEMAPKLEAEIKRLSATDTSGQ
ncbi:tetratricopeptide repeat protein [Ruegeria sp.]|uniref:tetratricopeptide repeat protein n=1 Tax=Ruegeria sp. TaxID=1879320 RepID=UPI003B5C17CD